MQLHRVADQEIQFVQASKPAHALKPMDKNVPSNFVAACAQILEQFYIKINTLQLALREEKNMVFALEGES
jgi:hypothetical protein